MSPPLDGRWVMKMTSHACSLASAARRATTPGSVSAQRFPEVLGVPHRVPDVVLLLARQRPEPGRLDLFFLGGQLVVRGRRC